LYPTGESKQDITLGIDAGYSTAGFSTITDKRELICGKLKLRNDIPELLEQRREYRRNRRNRLWHREPRFNNRGREDGWLAPSIRHKLEAHIRLVEKLKKVLPITKVIVEVASFDTQKMQIPEIKGIEYQQGELQGYEVREYLLEKWNRKCAYCGSSDVPLVEHIVPSSRGGSDRVSNLTIACHRCNQKKGNRTADEFGYPEVQNKAKQHEPYIKRRRYKLQPNDLVRHKGLLCRVKGVFNYGNWVRLIDNKGKTINTNINKAEFLVRHKGLQFQFS